MICNLCKLLHNPLKREMLLRIYDAKDGTNVGLLADEMRMKGLVASGVSQYLKEFETVGVIRRSRSGRYVNYHPNAENASPDMRQVINAFIGLDGRLDESTLDAVFGTLMNPFRAKVVAMLAREGPLAAIDICERTDHMVYYLKRDLQPAVDAGMIWPDDSEPTLATYHYRPPAHPFIQTLVSLC